MILLSRDRVEVIKLAERNKRILSLGNGSGTLGCYDSADFVSDEHLLTVWEFGRARVWQIATGKYTDLGDFKTGCDGATWFRRPPKGEGTWLLTLVHLAKDGADDVLRIRMASGKLIKSVKLPTVDAQEVSGSPDGRWYAIRDTPAHSAEDPSIHIYLADGNRYLNYPYGPHLHINDLGIKSMTWTPKGDILALSTFYGDLVLLDARTFTTKKILEHTDTITWGPMGITANRRGFEPLWRETASVLNERSYERIRQPASAVITRAKPSTDPEELGKSKSAVQRSIDWRCSPLSEPLTMLTQAPHRHSSSSLQLRRPLHRHTRQPLPEHHLDLGARLRAPGPRLLLHRPPPLRAHTIPQRPHAAVASHLSQQPNVRLRRGHSILLRRQQT